MKTLNLTFDEIEYNKLSVQKARCSVTSWEEFFLFRILNLRRQKNARNKN
jgi:hypothetical protein